VRLLTFKPGATHAQIGHWVFGISQWKRSTPEHICPLPIREVFVRLSDFRLLRVWIVDFWFRVWLLDVGLGAVWLFDVGRFARIRIWFGHALR
jgi:hypothetical protein